MNKSFLETIKAVDGEIFHLSFHQKRLESVLRSLGAREFPSLLQLLNPPKKGLYRCRVLYTSDSIEVSYHLYVQREIHTLKLIYDDSIVYDKKYTNRDKLNALFALKDGADDILIVKNRLVTDSSIANIAFYDGKKWVTPQTPLLEGVTRERLLQERRIFKQNIYVGDLPRFTKVALLNAMIDFDIIALDNKKGLYC